MKPCEPLPIPRPGTHTITKMHKKAGFMLQNDVTYEPILSLLQLSFILA